MELRAGFVYLRPAPGDDLCAELRFAPELQLHILAAEARGGSLTLAGAPVSLEDSASVSLALRRERAGVFVSASPGQYAFLPEPGATHAVLPVELRREKDAWLRGALHAEGGAWSLRATGAGAPGDAAADAAGAAHPVDLELVVLVKCKGRDECLSATTQLPSSAQLPPLLPPGTFLRTASGRAHCGGLEPIDENTNVSLPLPRRIASTAESPPFLSAFPRTEWDGSGAGCGALSEQYAPQYAPLLHADADADLDGEPGSHDELTWFSAGLRVGVGVGLGVCLGLGLGVTVLVSSYKRGARRLGELKQSGIGGLTGFRR